MPRHALSSPYNVPLTWNTSSAKTTSEKIGEPSNPTAVMSEQQATIPRLPRT